jgi:UDP-N-acetylglucosamine--N-acetylmuramyl-(pentapeptide) pyrophosphoryl-undecaprenol N-acetylglucosamine transferase
MKETLGYPLHLIAIRGLARKLSLSLVLFPLRLMVAVIQSLRICSRFRPDIVVGTGGYVAGPVIIAAAIKGIPRVLQEQNSFPGLVTRKLGARVQIIFTAYKRAEKYLPAQVPARMLGNPVRRTVLSGSREEALREFGLKPDRKTIVVLGGSQGARRINHAVLAGLGDLDDSVQILWQCGKREYTDVAAEVDKKDFAISLFPFIENMGAVYAVADLAVARAGALTIAELTACGIPSLLIPYPYATADHQTHNAAEVVEAGAAEMIPDADLDTVRLIERAMDILNSDRLDRMKTAAKQLGRPDAAAAIARDIIRHATNERTEGGTTDNVRTE